MPQIARILVTLGTISLKILQGNGIHCGGDGGEKEKKTVPE